MLEQESKVSSLEELQMDGVITQLLIVVQFRNEAPLIVQFSIIELFEIDASEKLQFEISLQTDKVAFLVKVQLLIEIQELIFTLVENLQLFI